MTDDSSTNNPDVIVNQLDVEWVENNRLDDKYDFFVLENKAEKGWTIQSEVADRIFTEKNICSVRYDIGRTAYIMMNKDSNNYTRMKEYLSLVSSDYVCSSITASELKKINMAILIQLLINGLNRIEIESLVFNNLTGRCYLFNPDWRLYRKSTEMIRLYGLEFKVSRSEADGSRLVLNAPVITFTKCSELHDDKKFKKAQYSLDGSSLRRAFTPSDDNFIIKGDEKHKNNVDYLTFSRTGYLSCKSKLMADLIDKFNQRYGDYVKLSFSVMQCLINETPSKDMTSAFREMIHKHIHGENVCIVNAYDDDVVIDVCRSIQNKLNSELGLFVNVSSVVMSNCLNIRVIHSPEYCEDNNIYDHHNDDLSGYSVQHIIAERYDADSNDASDVVLKELIIKKDIEKGKITIEKWSDRSFDEDITFVSFEKKTVDKQDHVDVYKMTIRPSGSFTFSGPVDAADSDEWFGIAFDENNKVNIPDGAIVMGDKINIIRDTGILPLPDDKKLMDSMDLLDDLRSEGLVHSRGQNTPRSDYSRKNIIHSLLDLKLVSDGHSTFYMSGYDSNNIRSTYTKAPHLRKVIPYDCNESFMDEVIDLMKVPFVKFGSLTVLPYPFKYLSEWKEKKKSNNAGIRDLTDNTKS